MRPERDPLDDAVADVRPFNSKVMSDSVIRTALTVEERGGVVRVFLPPLTEFAAARELLRHIEGAARRCGLQVVIEGYPLPAAAETQRLSVTPDPGVIEVNVHPSASWEELVANTTGVYESAVRGAWLPRNSILMGGTAAPLGGTTSPSVDPRRPTARSFAGHHCSLA